MKKETFACIALSLTCAISAYAQAPAVAKNNQPSNQADSQVTPVKKLEELLLCKKGTRFTQKEVAAFFREVGLVENFEGAYLPVGTPPVIFGETIVAAAIDKHEGRTMARVYYEDIETKHFSEKFGVKTIDEYADTDEPTYYKKNGARNKFVIVAAGDLFLKDSVIRPTSSVGCVYSGK